MIAGQGPTKLLRSKKVLSAPIQTARPASSTGLIADFSFSSSLIGDKEAWRKIGLFEGWKRTLGVLEVGVKAVFLGKVWSRRIGTNAPACAVQEEIGWWQMQRRATASNENMRFMIIELVSKRGCLRLPGC
jgi:hypothetical protein